MPSSSSIHNRRVEHYNRTKRIKLYSIASGSCILFVLLLYVIFRSPLFKISEFVVESSRPIDTDQLVATLKTQVASTRAGGFFGADHSFAWKNNLNYSAPEFSGIEIEKTLFSKTLRIRTIPRERFAVWCKTAAVGAVDPETKTTLTIPECWWVDTTGVAYESALETTGQLILTVYERRLAPRSAGSQVTSPQALVCKTMLTTLRDLNLGAKRIVIDRELDELQAETSGALIQFSLRFDPAPTAISAKFIQKPGKPPGIHQPNGPEPSILQREISSSSCKLSSL